MKEKLGLRNAIIWTIAIALLIMFFASFGASARMRFSMEGDYFEVIFNNAIWGCKSAVAYSKGVPMGQLLKKSVGSIVGIIAVILLFLASGGLVLSTLLIKDEKLSKILIIACGGVILVAGVLLFFVPQVAWRIMQQIMRDEGIEVDIATLKQTYAGAKLSSGFGIGGGIVSILFAGGVIASQLFVPDIKFIKSARKEEPKAE